MPKSVKEIQKAWQDAEKSCQKLRKLEDRAYKKQLPRLAESKASRNKDVGIWGDFFPDGLEDIELHLVDNVGQKLDFRVGPVYTEKGINKNPGIWIGVQRRYMSSNREIELLVSPEVWRKLSKEIEKRLKKFNHKAYGGCKKRCEPRNSNDLSHRRNQIVDKIYSIMAKRIAIANAETKPTSQTEERANRWIGQFVTVALNKSCHWLHPLINVGPSGEIVFEWWGKDKRKLTIYVEKDGVNYVKVWGADIDDEMDTGDASLLRVKRELWQWITGTDNAHEKKSL